MSCKSCGTKESEYISYSKEVVNELGTDKEQVLPILHRIQDKFNYLPEDALRTVCELTNITPAQITSVSTFYSMFRFRPAGQHRIKVCIGTACHVKGADNVYDAFKRHLEIADDNDTDADGLFTVEKVACLGCCMLAVAVQIDDITYGYVEPSGVNDILHDFLKQQKTSAKSFESATLVHAPAELRICTCSSCQASGSQAVYDECRKLVSELKLEAQVKNVSCTGVSYQAPLLEVQTTDGEMFRYATISHKHVRKILLRHLKPAKKHQVFKNIIESFLERIVEGEAYEPIVRYCVDVRDEIACDFLDSQERIATELGGQLAPLAIDEYRNSGGFDALKYCLEKNDPQKIISRIKESGLRGRGGGGFPTGKKWQLVYDEPSDKKYIICNGDEGDPGAFMDRMLMESFPFRVIEGMLIAAHTVGADEGILYVRHEYSLAIKRLESALQICRKSNLLGDNILDSNFSFDLKLYKGAGAFICGEETALIASIEGERGTPVLRPPFPAQSGLWGKPTLINNAETLSLIGWIIRNGSEKFSSIGTDHSAGTKTFALAGKVSRGGLVEVPMGMTIREIVEKIGGGVPNGKKLKAVQIGGPSGGCLPDSRLDLSIDYDALISAGAIMGSGGLVVLDEDDCMVDIARYFLEFTQDESCGKCTFCRVGTRRMLDILERICEGKGRPDDIDLLENLAQKVIRGSICNLGKTAPNPVLSTLRYFRDEYEAHLESHCPAGKCKALISYTINDNCTGCTLCAQACPTDAIIAQPLRRHDVIQENCLQCNVCREVCPADAVEVK